MNDDYLWDKSGEPDPEIQQLEELLGTLKYQPRPLEIPEAPRTARPRFYLPISLAAAIALALIGVGVWRAMSRKEEAAVARQPVVESKSTAPVNASPKQQPGKVENSGTPGVVADRYAVTHRPRPRARRVMRDRSELSSIQKAEGEKAKEQLVLALRLASAKLNLAQQRTQGTQRAPIIRNQHKAG